MCRDLFSGVFSNACRGGPAMKHDIRLALTGFMGVGKSSVARHLEHMTGCKRLDLDTIIEDVNRKSISELIDVDGIERFREIETGILRDIVERKGGCILSLGGGTWTIAGNRELIKLAGFTS